MYRLYDFLPSGNGYKVRLALAQLGLSFELVELDILRGETRTSEFLEKNPNGRIPLLEIEPGTYLAESNAILWYLADGTALVPEDRLARARVLQWQFFEQYNVEPNLAVARFWVRFLKVGEERRSALAEKRRAGEAALGVLERHLATRTFLVGERYSIADIALYAYTHVAEEGGIGLAPYPALRAWLERVRAAGPHSDHRPAGRTRRLEDPMKIMPCPLNGPRNITEFVCLGEVKAMPDPKSCTDAAWTDYLFLEDNRAGVVREWWMHGPTSYCFIAERNTITDEIVRTYPVDRLARARVGPPDATPG